MIVLLHFKRRPDKTPITFNESGDKNLNVYDHMVINLKH